VPANSGRGGQSTPEFCQAGYLDTDEAWAAAITGATLALVALITIMALLVAGRRSLQRKRQILGGDYLVR
jgi:hypothetical protein